MKRKLLWGLGGTVLSAAVLATPFLVAARCGGIVPAYQNKQVVISYNSKLSPVGYGYDQSASYGSMSPIKEEGRSTVETLIRIKNEGKLEVQYNKELKKYVVIKPSIWYRKLALAEAIIVTTKDNKQHVFDNDKHEVMPQKDATGFYKTTAVKASSKDQKSINGEFFEQLLEKEEVKDIKLVVRQGIKWVDSKNQATKYELKAQDFYYSWWRTKLLNTKLRHTNGGTKEIDDAIRAVLEPKSRTFSERKTYPNEYLLGLNNINSEKFLNEEEFIKKVTFNGKERETLEFTKKDEAKKGLWLETIDGFLSTSLELVPAPSEYIKEFAAQPKAIQKFGGTDQQLTTANEVLKNATSKVKEYGVYWYGQHLDTTLFVSPYIYDGTNTKLNEERIVCNKHFWDKEFLERKDKVETIVVSYASSEVDPKIFDQQQWDAYEQGLTTYYKYAALDEKVKTQVNSNPKKYGLTYRKDYNTDQLQIQYTLLPMGVPFVVQEKPVTDTKEYSYNDHYAKLMYGKTVAEIAAGEAPSVAKEFVGGKGLLFRTLINSAINFNYLSKFIDQKNQAWIAKVASDGKINTGETTPNEVEDKINVYYGIKNDYTKTDSITNKDSEEYIISHSSNPWRTKVYETAKQELKTLLDKYYQENSIPQTEKIEWSVYWPYLNLGNVYANMYKKYVEAVNELDPRLNVKFLNVTTQAELYNLKFDGKTNYNYQAWGYDYNGIGSGFDGMSWAGGHIIPTLSFLEAQKSTTEVTNIFKAFPAIKTLAEAFKKWYDENTQEKGLKFKPSLPFEKWYLLPNKYLNEYYAYLPFAKEVNGKVVVDTKNNSESFDPFALSSNFWITFQKSKTNEELIQLTHEFSNYIGISPDTKFYQFSSFSEALIDPHYVIPTSPSQNTLSYQDASIVENV